MKRRLALVALFVLVAACSADGSGFDDDDSTAGAGGGPSTTVLERLTQGYEVERLDLLLVIDNSRSMADKQQILRLAVPDLVNQLVNPLCVDRTTGTASVEQPAGPLDPCPREGDEREVEPILDIHIGIVSSSLGGHGSDTCTLAAGLDPSVNDGAHLLDRNGQGGTVPTYGPTASMVFDQFDIDGYDSGPTQRDTTGKVFVRSERLRRSTLARAAGKCELCGETGFVTLDGRVFLETHHVVPLAEGGADRADNIVALCPNHHREAHHGVRAMVLQETLLTFLRGAVTNAG